MKLEKIAGCILVAYFFTSNSSVAAIADTAVSEANSVTLSADSAIDGDQQDSMKVTRLLNAVSTLPEEQNEILFLAKGFLGTPYAAGTLETFPVEHLVVRTDSVDCTTFVEYVLALATANKRLRADAKSGAELSPYTCFKQTLQYIRYRNGILDGYTSRLHYFSDWIFNNQQKKLVEETTKKSPYAVRKVDLNFMSEHASLYPFLANDSLAVQNMRKFEERWLGYQMPYIPKERLNAGKDILKIKDGDILTLVTNIKGLDVVHVGFACWIDGKLHLLHASSAKKKVLLDPQTLFEYSRTKKAHIGIRVISPL